MSKTSKPTQSSNERTSSGESTSNPAARSDKALPTYQDVLDEALVETFPASDPISPGTAARRDRPISTTKNPTDWAKPKNDGRNGNGSIFTKPPQELQQAHQPQNGRAAPAEAAALAPERIRQLRAQLEDRARTLVDDLRTVEADRPDTPTMTQTEVEDMATHGEQLSRDAVRGAEQDRDAAELRDIAAALARIDEGHYGVCADCGTQIPLARLKAQPAALRCIECQERFERAHPPELKAVLMR